MAEAAIRAEPRVVLILTLQEAKRLQSTNKIPMTVYNALAYALLDYKEPSEPVG